MDGYQIKSGDKVYDVYRGDGAVTFVGNANITASFNGIQAVYDLNGVAKKTGLRNLFWFNPAVVAPPKDQALWERRKNALVSISELIV